MYWYLNLYHPFLVYRYLFWHERGGFVRRISLATHAMLTLEVRVIDYSVINLDCVNKQVYGFMRKSGDEYYIFASDYDGKNKKNITSGRFYIFILSVFGDLLYLMNYNRSYIKQMNTSNDSLPRNIAVERNYYSDLIVVHTFLQPPGELQYYIVIITQSIHS